MTLIQKIEQIFPNQEVLIDDRDRILIGDDIAIEGDYYKEPTQYNVYLNSLIDPTKRCIICKGDQDLISILEKID